LIRLRVRRFLCGNTECGRETFAEQVPGLTARYARRSTVLGRVLRAVALAVGGRAGSDWVTVARRVTAAGSHRAVFSRASSLLTHGLIAAGQYPPPRACSAA
jgi:orotidine-5'-phosphate decarboxylase